MSVNFQQYIILGFKRNPSELVDHQIEELEPYMDRGIGEEVSNKDHVTVLYDGMSGEYVVAGAVILRGERNQPLDGVISFGDMLSPVIERMGEENDWQELAGQLLGMPTVAKPDLIFLTHWC